MTETYDWTPHLGGEGSLPPIWKPAPGDTCEGTVVEVRDHEDKKYNRGVFPVVTIANESGDQLSIFAQTVGLKRALAERNVQVGDHLKVRYDGQDEESGFKNWSVKSTKPEPGETF